MLALTKIGPQIDQGCPETINVEDTYVHYMSEKNSSAPGAASSRCWVVLLPAVGAVT
jgi:hypothetical protein